MCAELQGGAGDPEPLGRRGRRVQIHDGQQQQADGDGRHEIDAHRMAQLRTHRARVQQDLRGVDQRETGEEQRRSADQPGHEGEARTEHGLRLLPADGEPGKAHNHCEEGGREVLQPLARLRRCWRRRGGGGCRQVGRCRGLGGHVVSGTERVREPGDDGAGRNCESV